MNMAATIRTDISPTGSDYDTVRRVIELISTDYRTQPTLEQIAAELGQSPTQLQKVFTRWAGLSPKAFLQAVTLDHAKRLLGEENMPLLDASFEVGYSGPGRLHDLFVTHEAMSPGTWKARGEGLTIRYGYHPSPFGTALVMATERGLAGLAFADPGEEQAAFDDLSGRWPRATYVADPAATAAYAARDIRSGTLAAGRTLAGRHDRHGFPATGLAGAPEDTARPRPHLFRSRLQHRQPRRFARGRRGRRRQSAVLRCSLSSGNRQVGRADRLPLGPDAQAGDARMGAGAG